MAGKKVMVIKNVGGGLRGSTSGLRFNPREAPEFVEEDRNLGRDDSEGRHRYEEKRRREKEKRDKKITSLRHLNIRARGKSRAQGDNQRHDEELSEMTGPVSSTGYPLDVAVGAKTGGGSAMGGPNIMTGELVDLAFSELMKDEGLRPTTESAPLRPRPPFTTFMGKPGKKPPRQVDLGTQELKYTPGKLKGPKRTRVESRHPSKITRVQAFIKKIVAPITRAGGFLPFIRRLTNRRFKGMGKPIVSENPGERGRQGITQTVERLVPSDYLPGGATGSKVQLAYQGGRGRTKNLSGRGGTEEVHAKATRQPKTASTPMGAGHTKDFSLATGASMISASEDVIPWAEDLLRKKDLTQADLTEFKMLIRQMRRLLGSGPLKRSEEIVQELDGLLMKASLTQADLTEFKMLIRELRSLLRSGGLRKAGLDDAEHDEERPTPNAHRLTTSSPTGATEIDPDDDPRYWGAHPMGLLLPRRGHM